METKTGGMVMDEMEYKMEKVSIVKINAKLNSEYEYADKFAKELINTAIKAWIKVVSDTIKDTFNEYYKRGLIVKKKEKKEDPLIKKIRQSGKQQQF